MGLIESLKTSTAKTYNGAVTHESSLNDCLDFFFLAGASRTMSEEDIIAMFSKAYNSNKNTALKILFWARDVRGGAGERRLFRIILKYLIQKQSIGKLLPYIHEYGRWDDLFFNKDILKYTGSYLREYLENLEDGKNDGLLFKWLPREKSKNKVIAHKIRTILGLTPKQYRLLLSKNTNVVETQMCQKEWSSIKYNSVPSKAFNLYREAFKKHDESRFTNFIEKVNDGEASVKAGAIFPSDIFRSLLQGKDEASINAQWASLPDYLNDENIMPVCDTSGSMHGDPIIVSVSLGVYLSERTKGRFKDHFITFEGQPRLQSVNGTVSDRLKQLNNTNSDCSTNLQGVFDLLLDVARRDNLSQEDLPTKLLIISDMEFNQADGGYWNPRPQTNFEVVRDKFGQSGYKMPQLVFWNVHGRMGNSPVQKTDKDVALVSGYSPSIVKAVLGGEDLTPIGVMNKAIGKYTFIDET